MSVQQKIREKRDSLSFRLRQYIYNKIITNWNGWMKQVLTTILIQIIIVCSLIIRFELKQTTTVSLYNPVGGVVQAASFAGIEQSEVKNSLESETLMPSSSQLAQKIFQLESSSGKNDKCRREGLGYNGYGYATYNGKYPCYKTQEEVEYLVIEWIEQHKKEGMSLNQLLCHYNQGVPDNYCDYLEKYNQLNGE